MKTRVLSKKEAAVSALNSKFYKVVLSIVAVLGLFIGLRTFFAPAYWGSALGGSQSRAFQNVACTSLKHCAFVGASKFGGSIRNGRVLASKVPGLANDQTLNSFGLSDPLVESVTCPTQKLCVAISFRGQLLIDFKDRWVAGGHLSSRSGEGFNTISCASPSFCMVGSSYGNAYLFSGGTWVNLGNPTKSSSGEILDVSCPVAGTCFVSTGQTNIDGGDDQGQIFSFSQGEWHTETPLIPNAVQTISCTDINFCVAGTNGDEYLIFQDGFWSRPQVITTDSNRIGNSEWLVSTSCSNRNFCIALSTSFYAYTWNGQKWDSGVPVGPTNETPVSVNAISCFTGDRCVVAAQGIWLHDHR